MCGRCIPTSGRFLSFVAYPVLDCFLASPFLPSYCGEYLHSLVCLASISWYPDVGVVSKIIYDAATFAFEMPCGEEVSRTGWGRRATAKREPHIWVAKGRLCPRFRGPYGEQSNRDSTSRKKNRNQ